MSKIQTYFLTIAVALFVLASCKPRPRLEPTIINLLVGEWNLPPNSKGFRTYEEKWEMENDSTFIGTAYALNTKTGDQYNKELTSIEYRNGLWRFTAYPIGQDTTVFDLTEMTGNKIRFENQQNDWPQYIQYTWYTKDMIVAEIGDTSNSKSFNMFREGTE